MINKEFRIYYDGKVSMIDANGLTQSDVEKIEKILSITTEKQEECVVRFLSEHEKLKCRFVYAINDQGNKIDFKFNPKNCYSIKLVEKSSAGAKFDRFEVKINPVGKVFWVLGFASI